MIPIEHLLFAGAVLLLAGILANGVSGQTGLPALLLFLVVGMLAGSEGVGGIYFDDALLAQNVGVVALIFILFAGGMDTDWRRVRGVLAPSISLATVGVLATALLVGLLAMLVLGFSLLEGLLLGAIVSSTDAAAVFSIMRSRSVGLQEPLTPLIELESGSNDPMAIFLTIALTQLLAEPGTPLLGVVPLFLLQMGVGAICGGVMGYAMVFVLNRVRLSPEGLYPVLTLALALLTYGLTATIGGSGFLAVYLAGLIFGNHDFVHKRSLMRFHDGLAWLMQITMFLVLGLLVFPSRLVPVLVPGLLLAAFLILVARPVSVLLSLAFTRFSIPAKLLVGWVGLRGAVPIILATIPLIAGLPQAGLIFNLVFFIVLTSVLIQGTTIAQVARRLGVEAPLAPTYHYPLEFVPTVSVDSRLVEVVVTPDSPAAGKSLVQLGLPSGALVVLIAREGDNVVPDGTVVLRPGDRLLMLAQEDVLPAVEELGVPMRQL